MAINNPTWVAGTAAQRLISVTKLNQLSADGCNTTDDIHPQYLPAWYSKNLFILATGGALERLTEVDAATALVTYGRWALDAANPFVQIAAVRIKCLPSVQATAAHFRYKGQISGTATNFQIRYMVVKNGTNLGNTDTPTATSPSFDTYSHDVSLVSPASGDYIEVAIALWINGASGACSLSIKDIEIYFS
jgi:hypothetical protein